jgi:uncharacterized FlgJ-related protein
MRIISPVSFELRLLEYIISTWLLTIQKKQAKYFAFRKPYTFLKTHYAMRCHTGDICIWNQVEYLEKGESYQNSITEIIKSFQVIFTMQP